MQCPSQSENFRENVKLKPTPIRRKACADNLESENSSSGTPTINPITLHPNPIFLRPIGIDLFARAGGLSLSFEQAGFNTTASKLSGQKSKVIRAILGNVTAPHGAPTLEPPRNMSDRDAEAFLTAPRV